MIVLVMNIYLALIYAPCLHQRLMEVGFWEEELWNNVTINACDAWAVFNSTTSRVRSKQGSVFYHFSQMLFSEKCISSRIDEGLKE